MGSEAEVAKKVRKAFCEPCNMDFNPPFAWLRTLRSPQQAVEIHRAPEHGGDIVYPDLAALEAAFACGSLHPGDLKEATAEALAEARRMLQGSELLQEMLRKRAGPRMEG